MTALLKISSRGSIWLKGYLGAPRYVLAGMVIIGVGLTGFQIARASPQEDEASQPSTFEAAINEAPVEAAEEDAEGGHQQEHTDTQESEFGQPIPASEQEIGVEF